MKKPLLQTIAGEKTGRVPVWIMRQAGRYLPEYRKLREKHDFLTLCLTPELAAEVTLQPVNRLDVDAAIIFSDILIPCLPMGCSFEFIEGKGPVFASPVRSLKDIQGLRIPHKSGEFLRVAGAIKETKNALPRDKALIGFCAAPFTLACYMVEGGTSKNFLHMKSLLYNEPRAFGLLMEKLTSALVAYLKIQAEAGAEILQVFDTWGGILSPHDFKRHSWPFLKKLVTEFKKDCLQPLIYFMRGNSGFLSILKDLPADVMGMDWTISLDEASRFLEDRFILQGNLDPAVLLSGKEIIREKALKILHQGEKTKGHIFNLGHGILPMTPPENARYLVETVHSFELK